MSESVIPQFWASEECQKHDELLQYTSFDSLTKILACRTLLLNSLGRVNDCFEYRRNGIEDLAQGFYVSCFCHYPYEIVPFWFMYGGNKNEKKVLLRIRNFASTLDDAFESNWAWTSENKVIFFDQFYNNANRSGGISCDSICKQCFERRQTIEKVRMFDINYKQPDDAVFTKEYSGTCNVSFNNGQSFIPTKAKDISTVGMYKTVHWAYEAETRLKCTMSTINSPYFDFLLLKFKDEVFRGLKIIANPWSTDEFIERIASEVKKSTLSSDIKNSIEIKRSELDGQIKPI